MSRCWMMILMILIGIGVGGRLWSGYDFEYKFDQMLAVRSLETWCNPLEIAHGMVASVGIWNPPGFYQFLMLFRWLGIASPANCAFFFAILSCVSVALPLLFRRMVPQETVWYAVLFTACSPLLMFMAGNVWAQLLLVPLSFLIFWCAVKMRLSGSPWWWAGAVSLALVAGSIHMAGFFVIPALLLLRGTRRWGRGDWGALACMAAVAILLFWLYAWSCWQVRAWLYLRAGSRGGLADFWDSFCRFSGGGFVFESFGEAYREVIGAVVSVPVAVFLVFGSILMLFICWGGAGARVFRRGWKRVPEVIRTALLLWGITAVIFGCSGVRMVYYYWFILWAPILFAAAYGVRFWRARRVRCWGVAGYAICALILVISLRIYVLEHGGHPGDFGMRYRMLASVQNQLAELERTQPLTLYVHIADPETGRKLSEALVNDFFRPYFKKTARAFRLTLSWDGERFRADLIPWSIPGGTRSE